MVEKKLEWNWSWNASSKKQKELTWEASKNKVRGMRPKSWWRCGEAISQKGLSQIMTRWEIKWLIILAFFNLLSQDCFSIFFTLTIRLLLKAFMGRMLLDFLSLYWWQNNSYNTTQFRTVVKFPTHTDAPCSLRKRGMFNLHSTFCLKNEPMHERKYSSLRLWSLLSLLGEALYFEV